VQVEKLQANSASRQELIALEALLILKADKDALDQVSGGNASVFDGLQSSVRELKAVQAGMSTAMERTATKDGVDALLQALERKADNRQLQELFESTSSAIDSVQSSLADLHSLKGDVTAVQNYAASKEELASLEAMLVSKADKSELDHVSGGSSGALTELRDTVADLRRKADSFADAGSAAAIALEKRLTTQHLDASSASQNEFAKLTMALDAKADKVATQKAATTSESALRVLEETVKTVMARLEASAKTDQMALFESKLAGKAEASDLNKLATSLEAVRSSIKNVTGSEQMATVQTCLEALSADVQKLQASSMDTSAMDKLKEKVSRVEGILLEAACKADLDAVKVWPPLACVKRGIKRRSNVSSTWHCQAHEGHITWNIAGYILMV
jgi:hypothetical protein